MNKTLLLLFTVLAFFTGRAFAGNSGTDELPSLNETATAVLNAITTGNKPAFINHCSQTRIVVVDRYMRWDEIKKHLPARAYSQTSPLDLDPEDLMIWEERQSTILAGDLAENDEFSGVYQRFRKLVSQTYPDGVHLSVDVSLNMWDAWQCRMLGPAMTGKVASNCHWYIYFTKEKDKWKVWRLECDTH